MVSDLNIRQIQIFILAADTGSFTKAGEKMYMTQSMVSKSVASVEKNLGLQLFVRNSQGVVLTPAGRIIYQSWKKLVEGMEQTVALAHAAQAGSFHQVFISDFSTSVKKEYLWPYVERFKNMYPEVDVLLETSDPGKVLERLENNRCDIAYAPFWNIPLFEQNKIRWKYVLRCPLCVWVHKSSPLYGREHLDIMDLKEETFIIVSPLIMTHYEKMVLNMCRKGGFEPRKIIRVADAGAATLNLKMGKGIVIRDAVFDSAETHDIRVFDLEGTEGGTIIAWRSDLKNKCARDYLALYD